MSDTQVLIIGAGPTGLVLASGCQRRATGPPHRQDRRARHHLAGVGRAGADAGALPAVWPGRAALRRGAQARGRQSLGARPKVARVVFGDDGQGLSPFPYMLIFPQDEHERLLIERLLGRASRSSAGDRAPRLRGRRRAVPPPATARRGRGACEAAYLAGCDGAHSRCGRRSARLPRRHLCPSLLRRRCRAPGRRSTANCTWRSRRGRFPRGRSRCGTGWPA